MCYISGVLVLNLVCRDEALKEEILQRVKQVFGTVFVHNIEDEVNVLVYAVRDIGEQQTKESGEKNVEKSDVKQTMIAKFTEHCTLMNKHLYKQKCDKNEVDLVAQMEDLSVV